MPQVRPQPWPRPSSEPSRAESSQAESKPQTRGKHEIKHVCCSQGHSVWSSTSVPWKTTTLGLRPESTLLRLENPQLSDSRVEVLELSEQARWA